MSTTTEPTVSPEIAKPRTPSFLEVLFNHPAGFWFIFWGELAERCSYYGMMSILARFISEQLSLGDDNGSLWVSLFKAACYFLPLLGGFLADQYLGKYRLIVIFSIPYILGHVVLAGETYYLTLIALGLLAMGSGVIKPNISTLMGMTYDQKRPGDEQLRSMAFGMFYMAINIGAAISYAVLPKIRDWTKDDYGYSIAFLCPAVLMAISFVIFAVGKPFYAVEKIERRSDTPEERAEKWATMLRISGLFLIVTFFWAMFDQSHTTWVYFARDFMELKLFGYDFSPEQLGTLNPVMIVLFVPALQLVWNVLERAGWQVRATDKMMMGLILTGATMGIMSLAGYLAGPYTEAMVVEKGQEVLRRTVPDTSKVTIWWEVLAFTLLTVAEVLISVTGLELAFVVAPKTMKSFVTAMWLLTVGLANLFINAPIAGFYPAMPPGPYFGLLAGVMIFVVFAFYFVAQRFNQATSTDEDAKRKAAALQIMDKPEGALGGSSASDGILDKSRREAVVDPDRKPS